MLMIYDIIAVNLSYFLALLLRFDLKYTKIDQTYMDAFKQSAPIYTVFCIIVFMLLKLYRSIWRFASYIELMRIMAACFITTAFNCIFVTVAFVRMPLVYYVFGAILQCVFLLVARFSYRLFLVIYEAKLKSKVKDVPKIMIIGAGSAGQMILRDINRSDYTDERVACVIDDDESKWGRYIEEVPVVGGRDEIMAAAKKYGITVMPLKVKYPQGGEKQLIKATVNREIPAPPALPIDVGCVVQNVGSTFAIYEAVQKNKPLFERVVTVTGKSVKSPKNILARVGTPLSHLIAAVGGLPEDTGKVVNGGPMMGKAVKSLEVPVTKGTSGVLMFKQSESVRMEENACIRCGKCVSACCMGLEPYLLKNLAKIRDFDALKEERVLDCIECGSCSFTCPAGIPITDYIRYGKATVTKILRSKK
ncbi:MAG: RnfABCDGE type electron transport complex subunit C [Bacteroidales bacterium]|nr:RnfABCDGE type electron transport complex subunit C [Bacteroidales bacterium]